MLILCYNLSIFYLGLFLELDVFNNVPRDQDRQFTIVAAILGPIFSGPYPWISPTTS